MEIPSQSDLIGKALLGDRLAQEDEKAADCVCYMAYTAWKAAEVLKKRLCEEDMYSLYTEIEMPLIYSLFHMEQEGVKGSERKIKRVWRQAQNRHRPAGDGDLSGYRKGI